VALTKIALTGAILGFALIQGACSRSDTQQVRQELRTSGQELRKELKSDARVVKQEAHKAAEEAREDARKAQRDLDNPK
jgi:outer membrane murein-binding lipoprotein Lpp